ncbi:MAG: GGDEF domain-containing protein [Pseudomonadales bacterium]|nr:GGDEF domain-containing protein [Pseudomonadales bacterium]
MSWFTRLLATVGTKPPEERIVLTLCLLSALALFPFAIARLVSADFGIAAIDFLGACASLVMVGYIMRTGKVKGPGLCMVLVSVSGIVVVVNIQGASEAYFLYPVILWTFFLVTPKLALVIGFVAIALTAPVMLNQMEGFTFAKFVVSMLGCILFAYTFSTMRNSQRDELVQLSTKDGLTGAGNRRALDEKMQESILSHGRQSMNVSLLLLDLDNFKEINDQHGHLIGDQILISVTEIIQSRIRATDGLFRYGGDEFVILANGADLSTAIRLAEDIRERVESFFPTSNDTIHNAKVSLSLGIAQYVDGQNSEQWLEIADQALLQAKRDGRNRVLAAAT